MFISGTHSEMALTQEAILKTLLEGGGQVKNAELLSKFKEPLNCSDPAEKKRNRDLFKTFVNNIAVVKEFQEAKYIVLKKVYHHLLKASDDAVSPREDYVEGGLNPENEKEKIPVFPGKQDSDDTTPRSPIETALERSRNVDFTPKKFLHFTVPLKSDAEPPKKETSTNKPFALPLRMPQIDISRSYNPSTESQPSPQCKRKTNIDPVPSASSSPQLRKHFKTPKPAEPRRYLLDPVEHEWLVKTAAGQWSQVYGLLLMDSQLAEKKDFMSGFTALHWAVKCGKTDMVCRIIELSRKSDQGMDVNTKSNGGYTPLHIAAIHNQLSLIELLVHKYGANGNLRDNYGKKPYHYLHEGVPKQVRELLGDPKANNKEAVQVRDDSDPHKYLKSRLFPQNPVGVKKKNRARTQFISLGEDGRAERDEPVPHKQRVASAVFP